MHLYHIFDKNAVTAMGLGVQSGLYIKKKDSFVLGVVL